MKEKIIEILKENYFDEIPELLMKLIDAEVDRRIKERMPRQDELIDKAQKVSKIKLSEREKTLIRMTYNVLRSRLTSSEKPNNSEQQLWRDIQEGDK